MSTTRPTSSSGAPARTGGGGAGPPSPMARHNHRAWLRPGLVAEYAHRRLRPVEEAILERHRGALSGRVLELGCGAGRVTGHLIDLAEHVHGLDLMPEMVRHCRHAYQGATFSVGDLRDLSSFRVGTFDAIVAADNVVDVLDDAERRALLDQLHGLLVPGGLLVLSSHNLAAAPLIPEPTQVGSPSRRVVLENVLRLPIRLRNRRRLREFERHLADHAILNDVAHDYSLLHYYVGRDAQQAQLAEHGFTLLECLDPDAAVVPAGEDAAHAHWLHYVCRATPRASQVAAAVSR